MNGTYIPGAVDSLYYPTQSGNYSVLISENNCPEVSSDISVVLSSPATIPVISASGSISSCLGGSIVLSVPNIYSSYNWSSGGSSNTESITSSGTYNVTVTDNAGCAAVSFGYTINASFVSAPEICIVGVDPVTNNNIIVWERPQSTAIDSFFIYKESNQTGVFNKIGGIAYADTTLFVDYSSNTAVQAYRYRLSLLDSCGTESSSGSMHKTIHLTINQGMGTTWNLMWSHYDGFPYTSYNIYRGTSPTNLSLIATVASNLNSYTDLNAPAGALYYQIEVISNVICNPIKTLSFINSSRSNIVDNLQVPISKIEENTINVYPNPTTGNITVALNKYYQTVSVKTYNITGQLIASDSFENTTQFDQQINGPSGCYFIALILNEATSVVLKILKE